MTIPVRIRAEAERDLAGTSAWYEDQRIGLGQEFLDEVMATYGRISEFPEMYPLVHRDVRRAVMRRFPFGVYYRVIKRFVLVVAVMHGSRNPSAWQRRS